MLRLSFLAHGVLICAVAAGAQSLGDVAKKEKKRRATIEKSESSSVITESELGGGRDGEASDASTDTSTETGAIGKSSPGRVGKRPSIPLVALPSSDSDSVSGATGKTAPSDNWDTTFSEYQKAYAEAKAYLQFAEGFQKHCKDGTPPPRLPPIAGGFWMLNCDSFPEEIAEARRLMKQIQDTCHEHARRLGVVPGRASLR